MPSSPTDFERELLEELAGLRPPRPWGAAVGAALGFLKHMGYVNRMTNKPTEKGLKYLEERKKQQ